MSLQSGSTNRKLYLEYYPHGEALNCGPLMPSHYKINNDRCGHNYYKVTVTMVKYPSVNNWGTSDFFFRINNFTRLIIPPGQCKIWLKSHPCSFTKSFTTLSVLTFFYYYLNRRWLPPVLSCIRSIFLLNVKTK